MVVERPDAGDVVPYFWAKDDSVEAIETALRAVDDIESFRVVDTVNGEALVRVEWERDLDGLLDVMAETGATILEAEGRADIWTFKLRFDDHENLTSFYRQCAERGISIDLRRIYNPGVRGDLGEGLDITDVQRETLQIAFERGYFDVPRRITLTKLAAKRDVSDTAVSQQIRRGLSTVLQATLDESVERSGSR